jgi:hypothetical protein
VSEPERLERRTRAGFEDFDRELGHVLEFARIRLRILTILFLAPEDDGMYALLALLHTTIPSLT